MIIQCIHKQTKKYRYFTYRLVHDHHHHTRNAGPMCQAVATFETFIACLNAGLYVAANDVIYDAESASEGRYDMGAHEGRYGFT